MDNLYNQLANCHKCRLSQNRLSVVPGRGNNCPGAITFIGEAPGLQESTWLDENGNPYPCPFVGKAGLNLDGFLEKAGIQRADIFITNAVKCRPTKKELGKANRPPRSDEVKACAGWLDHELTILKPRLIVTLGNVALKRLTGAANIGDAHGKLQVVGDFKIFPIFHPAALIYRRQLIKVMENDLVKLAEIIETIS